MATKSFLKSIAMKDKSSANAFINALENAEGKQKKKVNYDKKVNTLKDCDKIRKLLKK